MASSSLKTINLLTIFTKEKTSFSLQEIVDITQYNKSTLFRMLTDLTTSGLLERNPETKKYHIGRLVKELEKVRQHDNPVEKIIANHARILRDDTQETVHYTYVQQNTLLVGNVFYSKKRMRIMIDNIIIPFDKTGSGFLFLTYLPDARRDEIMQAISTPVSRDIHQCQQQGYYINDGNLDSEAISIVAPIFDENQNIIFCLSVVSPKVTASKAVLANNKKLLLERTNAIMQDIGGVYPDDYPAILAKKVA